MSRAHPTLVAYQVRFGDVVVRSIVSLTTKPIYRGTIIHPSNISILVALKVLGNLVASIKGLIVI